MTTPSECAAVRGIFTAPALAGRLDFFTADDDLDWAGIVTGARAMPEGRRLSARAACDLRAADHAAGIREPARQLDSPGFARVAQTMRTRRGEAGS